MGTRRRGTKDEARVLDAYTKLVRAAELVTTRIHRHLTAVKLTISQFCVLEALFQLGPLSQRDLAENLLKSGGNITMVIDNLEKRQLVKRERSTEDRRFVSVCLTDEGRQLISKLFPQYVAAVVEEMSILTESEQEELSRLCRRLERKE